MLVLVCSPFLLPLGMCPCLPSLVSPTSISLSLPPSLFFFIFCPAEPAGFTGLKWKSIHTTGTAGEAEREEMTGGGLW